MTKLQTTAHELNFINEEHKQNFEEIAKISNVIKSDKYWKLAYYLIAHPDLFPLVVDWTNTRQQGEGNLLSPFGWYNTIDVHLGSGMCGLIELAIHLFTGGREKFDLDSYLYKWDGTNFEVAMEIIRIAKKG